jgi:alpha-D-xyloside xylohydrolase
VKSLFHATGSRLVRAYDSEQLWVEAWGPDSLRIRATHGPAMETDDWALLAAAPVPADIAIGEDSAEIRNGRISASVTDDGRLEIRNRDGRLLLREYVRRRDTADPPRSPLKLPAREFKPLPGGDYAVTLRFESDPAERIFGMGQYQHEFLDLKHCTLELAHRNSQSSVPFALSSLGYGLLWNNPAIGRVTFARNVTEWQAFSTRQLDLWITVGDKPAEIVEAYARATGTVPLMPESALGLWQSKLRYRTEDELLEVAREYVRRDLPLAFIVADFMHWERQGDWAFDPRDWPDPAAMVDELRSMGIELLVSVWPTVDKSGPRYAEMLRHGYLIRTERGIRTTMEFMGSTVFVDVTNPDARRYFWDAVRAGYWDVGVRHFWLDEAEPEYPVYDFDHYRYHLGSDLQIGNLFPLLFAKAFFDGQTEAGDQQVMTLVRATWAGGQRYGALVWSGDTDTTWTSFRQQVRAGLNMGIAGIPWWTSDIGGFHGGSANDPAFRELVTRWFQFAVFCPILRMHGDREPHTGPDPSPAAGRLGTGGPNELWSFGDETLAILRHYLEIRERLRPYIATLMRAAHERGTPVMRPLFYDFPDDRRAWAVDDAFMFGPDVLVAPVLDPDVPQREVYLPAGTAWRDAWTGDRHDGGTSINVATPIEQIPVFVRASSALTLS